jgi:prevent-host-death family protein
MVQRYFYINEFAKNPFHLIHEAMNRESDVIITDRGIPVVRLMPMKPAGGPPSILGVLAALPDVVVSDTPMSLPTCKITLRGEGPSGSEMLLDTR